MLPILPTEHTLRLRLLDTDTSNLHLLQHLNPIKPRTLRIDTTFITHRDTRPLAQSPPLIQLSLLYPRSAVLVDLQRLTASNELVPCGPSGKAAVRGEVFGKDPDETVVVLFGYCGESVMRFTLACGRVAPTVRDGERVNGLGCAGDVHIR